MAMVKPMNGVGKQLVSSVTIATLLGMEAVLFPGVARSMPQNPAMLQNPVRLSQLRPWKKSYNCGSSLITLSQQGNSDRYTYEAVNQRGQTLTVGNGTGYARQGSSIYSFATRDGNKFVVEDFRNGQATLTTSQYPSVDAATFDCTVVRNDGSGSTPPVRWSHTYQCGEYTVTLREENSNTYSYRTRDLFLRNGERQNTGRSALYSFYNGDYSYKVEDSRGDGPATLTVTQYGRRILFRNCRN